MISNLLQMVIKLSNFNLIFRFKIGFRLSLLYLFLVQTLKKLNGISYY